MLTRQQAQYDSPILRYPESHWQGTCIQELQMRSTYHRWDAVVGLMLARQAAHACTAAVFGLKVDIMLSSDPKLLSIALRSSPLGGSNSCSPSKSCHAYVIPMMRSCLTLVPSRDKATSCISTRLCPQQWHADQYSPTIDYLPGCLWPCSLRKDP